MASIENLSDRQVYDALYRLVNQEATVTCNDGTVYTGKIFTSKWSRGNSSQPSQTMCISLEASGYKYIPLADIATVRMH